MVTRLRGQSLGLAVAYFSFRSQHHHSVPIEIITLTHKTIQSFLVFTLLSVELHIYIRRIMQQVMSRSVSVARFGVAHERFSGVGVT